MEKVIETSATAVTDSLGNTYPASAALALSRFIAARTELLFLPDALAAALALPCEFIRSIYSSSAVVAHSLSRGSIPLGMSDIQCGNRKTRYISVLLAPMSNEMQATAAAQKRR